ncbi:MAG: hypothetical protein ACOY0T_19665 [Myxococcota bacterium]
MDCADILDSLSRGEVPDGAEVREHVGVCEHCRELLADGGVLGAALVKAKTVSAPATDGELQELTALIDREVGVRAWLRSQRKDRRTIITLALFSVSAATSFLLKPRNFWPNEVLGTVLSLVLLLAALVATIRGFMEPLSTPHSNRRRAIAAACGLLLPFLLALLPALLDATTHWPAAKATACLIYGAAFSVPLFAGLWLFDRAERLSFTSLYALAGASGLAGNLILILHCPSRAPLHLLLGHATVGLFVLVVSTCALLLRRN